MIRFPPFTLDVVEQRLWKGKQELDLRKKPFSILAFMVANPNRLVTHDELLAHVWGGAVVSDSAVRTHLHDLRSVLGEGVIETVVGRGYRFIAKLESDVGPPAEVTPVAVNRNVVGRARELALLEAGLQRAMMGHRQICFITGEPGIGKTTLVDAFIATLEARKIVAVSGHCIEQYGTPEPYLAVIEMFGRLRRTPRGEQAIATLVRHAPSFVAQLPHLISDAQLDEVTRRSRPGAESHLLRELAEAIEALCSQDPLVIVLEDLQWSDVATIDLVSLLGQRGERAKLLLIATSRRAESQTVTHPLNRVMRTLVARSGATAIPVERINQAEVRRYLEIRFPDHELPASFLELVERITAGTPLFLVSVLDDFVDRGLIEQRDGHWRLTRSSEDIADYRPATVRQLIDIQLDRLVPDEQRILEAASLIGPLFSPVLVAAALELTTEQVDDVCENLVKRALFLTHGEEETWPNGAIQPRYGVTHALVQEVCLDRCPAARRTRWHRLIAEHLDAAYGERAVEVAHVLATHYEQGQALPRALHYYLLAGDRTARRFSIADASRLYHRAHRLIPRLPETTERDALELRVLTGICQSVTLSSDGTRHEPVELFDRMVKIARKLNDIPQLYAANVNLAFRFGTLANYVAADRVDQDLVTLEQTASIEPDLRRFADGSRGIMAMWKGELEQGLALLEPITDPAAPSGPIGGILGNADRVAFLLIYQCTMRWVLGDPERALEDSLRGVAQATRAGDPYALGANLTVLARLRFLRRDNPRDIRQAAERVPAIPEADVWYTQAALLAGAARSQQAPLDTKEADELFGLFRGRTATFPMGATATALPVIEFLRRSGQRERAAALVEEMIAFARDNAEFIFVPEHLRLRGEFLEDSDPAGAARAYADAIASARLRNARSLELRAVERARLLQNRLGADRDEATRRVLISVLGE